MKTYPSSNLRLTKRGNVQKCGSNTFAAKFQDGSVFSLLSIMLLSVVVAIAAVAAVAVQ